MGKRSKHLVAAACVASAALVLTSCSGSNTEPASGQTLDPGTSSGAESPQSNSTDSTVVISGLVVAANAAIPMGIEQGIFEEHGLDVEFNSGLDAGAQLPALTTNATQFSVCNLTSALTAIDKGLDIRIVSGFNYTQEQEPDANGVVVKKDSGIESFADLAGKTVSVTSVQSQGDLMIKEATRRAGGDPSAIKFNEIGFPNMQAQLELGNTDAIWLPEPFLTMAQQDPELKTLGFSYHEVQPGSPVQMICADGNFVEDNPETVASMRRALTDVADAIAEDPAPLRKEITEFTTMPDELAQSIILETFDTEIRDSVQVINELAADYGIVSSPVDLNSVVVSN